MAILSNFVAALALASCVTVIAAVHNPYDDQYYAADPSFENKYYKPPCAFNFKYNPAELASLDASIFACLKDLPGVQWPTNLPSLDCTRAGVDSLRNAESRTLSGVPAAVKTCLELPSYSKLLNEDLINKAVACVERVKA